LIASLELAKQLSSHCHVTYLISAYKVDELERKGLITACNNSETLDIVGLNDGINQTLELPIEDFQINLNNMTKVLGIQKTIYNNLVYRYLPMIVYKEYLIL